MNNLMLRSLTGAVYVAVICAAVLLRGWFFGCVFAFFAAAAVNEFITLAWNKETEEARIKHQWLKWMDVILSALLVFASGWFSRGMGLGTGFAIAFAALFLYMIVRPVVELYTREATPMRSIAFSYMAQVYITLPLVFLPAFHILVPANGACMMLAMFIMIWLSDTGAYLVGSAIGRHKLFPRISPAKSWEGFVGGVLFATLSGLVFYYGFPRYYSSVSLLRLCGMGLTVAIFSTWGDLVESLIKRSTGVKDSGKLLPGHGGMLDRIDSLLLVIPATLVYLFLTGI